MEREARQLLVSLLKDFMLEQQELLLPDYDLTGTGARSGVPLVELLEEAGFACEFHQQGIPGTLFVVVPKA